MTARASFDFTGTRALITGATSGIGHAVATLFRDAGAEVTVTGTKPSAGEYDVDLTGMTYRQLVLTDLESITALAAGMLATVLPWSALTARRALRRRREWWPVSAPYPLAADQDCTNAPANAATASRWAFDRLAAPETVASETRIVSPTRVSTLNDEPSCCCVALLPFAGFSRSYTKSEPFPSPGTAGTLPTEVVTTHFIPEPGSDSSTPEPAHRLSRDVIAVNAAFAAPREA